MNRTTALLLSLFLGTLMAFAPEGGSYGEIETGPANFFLGDRYGGPFQSTFAERQLTEVKTISDLRRGKLGRVYKLTGEAIITFQQNYHNRKYIQDNSGAILIDDKNGVMSQTYRRYDGITGLIGKLRKKNGVLEVQPVADPGRASSSGNVVKPVFLTIEEFDHNPERYESQLIALENVWFRDADGSAVFQAGQEYTLTDGRFNAVLKTEFYNADYIGSPIPRSSQEVLEGIAGSSNGYGRILIRDKRAFKTASSPEKLKSDDVKIYPNPAVDHFIVEVKGSAQVEVFSIIGQLMRRKSINDKGTLSLNDFKSGVYMVKIVQNGQTVTKKLVVQ